MNNTDFVSHSLTKKEKIIGTIWLIFQTVVFATLLQLANLLLPTPLSQTEINAVYFFVNFTAVILIFRHYLWGQLRLVPQLVLRALGFAAAGFVVYLQMNGVLMQIIFMLDPNFISVNDAAIEELVAKNYLLMFVGSVILVPITEECLFRGVLFRGLYDHSPVLAWILSVVLFAAVHVLGYIGAYPIGTILLCFVQYIPAGLCLAGAYYFSGSLLAPILIHTLVNLLGMLALR